MQINSINLENFYHLPCGVYWKDSHGIYQGCNDYYADIGLKGTDFIGNTDGDMFLDEIRNQFQMNDKQVLATETLLTIIENVRVLDINQEPYQVISYKQPLYNRSNKIIGVIGFSFNINKQPLHLDSLMKANNLSSLKILENMAKDNYFVPEEKNLTQRQLDCLFYLVQGKTAKEIAASLSLSKRTVEHHLHAAKLKYNCFSRSALISKALSLPDIKNRLLLT